MWPDVYRGGLNTFGAYQTYYETQQLFSSSSSSISWIGSAQSSLLLVLGLITGPLYDAGYFYHVLFSGSFMILFGQIMLSLSKEWYQVLLSQGFCIGIGTGLVLIPGVAVLSTYFSTKLALANGVAAAGSGLGKPQDSWFPGVGSDPDFSGRGHSISDYIPPTFRSNWLCLDLSSDWPRHISDDSHSYHSIPIASETILQTETSGPHGIPRARLYVLCIGRNSRVHLAQHPVLLYSIFCYQ